MLRRLSLTLLWGCIAPVVLRQVVAQSVPPKLSECEGSRCDGVWTFNGTVGTATWSSGARANLKVDHFDQQGITIQRTDVTGNTPGLTAIYTGKRNGNRIEGDVTWKWPGHWNNPANGKWSATIVGLTGSATAQPTPKQPGSGQERVNAKPDPAAVATAGQPSASKNSTSTTASQPTQKNQTPSGAPKVNLTGSWTTPPVVNRVGQKVMLSVTIVQKGDEITFIQHQPSQPNLILFDGRFETTDRITGKSRSSSNSIDNPNWTSETYIVVDASHIRSAIGPISFTKVSGPESVTAASATPYKEAKGYLREQPFNLNGVWQGVEQNSDLFKIVIIQKDDGELTMRYQTVTGPFFRAKYVKNPSIAGQGMASYSDLGNPTWINKSIFIDDPDHIRYIGENMSFVLFRVSNPPPHDLACDDQNSSHVARKFATDRGRTANREGDSRSARCWLTIGANQGYAPAAQSFLAALLLREPSATGAEYKLAFEMATKSAQQGDIAGQLELASLYREGKGTPEDVQKAQFWTQKAQQTKDAAQWKAWNTNVFLGLTPLDIAGLALKSVEAADELSSEQARGFQCADGHRAACDGH